MARWLFTALFWGILLGAVLSGAQQPPAPAAPVDQSAVFSVSSTLVQVDAEVTDSKQRHVTDLQAGDFEVVLDGKVQTIANFSYVRLENQVENGTQSTGDSSPPAVRPENVRRSMVIVVDDLGLSFSSVYFVRRALHHFVDQQMQPGDLIAIWQTGRSNSVFQQLTSDKHVLNAAIESLRWNPRGRGLLDAFHAHENPLEGQQIPNSSPTANDTSKPLTTGERDERGYLSSGLARQALGVVNELADELRLVGGRKAVVLFSDGFPNNLDKTLPSIHERALGSEVDQELLAQMRNLIDNTNRSGTVLYTIDARGLEYMEAGDVMKNALSQQPLITLAEETGGFATVNSNGLADALERVREDQKGYYLIGFKAPHTISTAKGKTNIDFHSLHVRLKAHRGLHVRSRAGFWGQTDEASRPEYNTPQAQMRLAALSLFNRADIHVRLTALYTRTADAHPAVRNLIYIDARDVSFKTNAAGKHEANLDVLVMGSASQIDFSQTVSRRLQIVGNDDELDHLRHSGILLTLDVPLKGPGPYQVRASVRDANSAALGSAGQFVDIPNLKKVHLALTTPIIKEVSGGKSPSDQSSVLREFHAGSDLSLVSMIETDHDETKDTASRSFDAGIHLYSEGKPILNSPVPVKDVQGRNVHAMQAEIRLNQSLPAGQYYLEATATDRSGKTPRSTSAWVEFRIVP